MQTERQFFEGIDFKTITLRGGLEINLIDGFAGNVPFDHLGSIGYNGKNVNGYRTQYFFLSKKGSVGIRPRIHEEDLIKRAARSMTNHEFTSHMEIIDFRLPKANGFSGIKLNLRLI